MCRYYVWICRYCPGIDHRNHRHVTAFYSGPEYFCGFSHSRCVDCVVQTVSVFVLCVQCTSFYVMIWRALELLNSPPSDKNDTKLGKSSVTGIVQACYSNAIMIHVIIRQNAVFICLYAKKSLVVVSHTERGVTFMLCPEDVSGLDCVCLLAPCFITSACRVRRGRGLPALAQLRAGPGCAAPCPSVCGVLSHSTVSASEKLNTCLISHWNHLQAVLLWVKLRAQLTISLDCSKWDVIWCYLHMLNCRCRYIYRYRL